MKKLFLLLSILFLLLININGQFLHYGVSVFASPELNLKFFQYEKNEYVFYFANEQNETIRFDGIDTSMVRALNPYPSAYVRYDFNLRWFLQADLYYFWFRNNATYSNSIDFSDYVDNFQGKQVVNYNSVQLKWRFAGFRFIGGYTFNKKKAMRPFIFSGFSIMHLSDFRMGDAEPLRKYRNNVIFEHLDTFKKITFYNTSGWGIRYLGFTFTVYSFSSIGSVDIFDDLYKAKTGILDLDELHPNYESVFGVFVSFSFNFYSKNFSKNSDF